ncbi:MAG: DegT/DnrJ/EryC1/StrS family aminotransferase [Candidatus Hermodarchaeota archaeon]
MYMDDEIKSEVMKVLDSGYYIKGPNLKAFEENFKKYLNVKYSIGVSSGTAALFLAYNELKLSSGDEVIMPSHTFLATASPLAFFGAKPIFVDVNPETYCLDIEDLKEKITPKTRCITPVHLYGHPADMNPILEIAKDHDLKVIEDACQAHGAEYKGRKVGSIGDIGIFSFFPSKNMTVGGDGGMIVTNNDKYGELLSVRRDHGRTTKYRNDNLGLNFRLNEIQAAIGKLQLKHLDEWVSIRREYARKYNEIFKNYSEVKTPIEKDGVKHSYYVYTIQMDERDKFIDYFQEKRIATGLYYPIPVHKQPVIEKIYGKQPKLPITEEIVNKIVSLPLSSQLTSEEFERIKLEINNYMRGVK